MSIFGATQIITDKGKYAACLRLSAGDGNGKIAKIYGKAASRNGGWLCPDVGGRYGGGPRPVKSRTANERFRSAFALNWPRG